MKSKFVLLLPELRKFINASVAGRRLMPSGKKVRKGTLAQYEVLYRLLLEFEQSAGTAVRLLRKNRITSRDWQKERVYWKRVFKQFTGFIYQEKGGYDQYLSSVLKVLRTFYVTWSWNVVFRHWASTGRCGCRLRYLRRWC